MNSKKAKKLRALVKHLQEKGAIEGQEWAVYGQLKGRVVSSPSSIIGAPGVPQQYAVTGSRMLDPACGKAIYKQMKKRSENMGHRPK